MSLPSNKFTRRDFIHGLSMAASASMTAQLGLGLPSLAQAQTAGLSVKPGVRILWLFAGGGMHLLELLSAQALKPGAKGIDPYFYGLEAVPVPGKPKFLLTSRSRDLAPSIQATNTALILGAHIGVPVHEFAIPFVNGGNLEFFTADNQTPQPLVTLGAHAGDFPAHMQLGVSPRLGPYRQIPYLQAVNLGQLYQMGIAAQRDTLAFTSRLESFRLGRKLDDNFMARLTSAQRAELKNWYLAQEKAMNLIENDRLRIFNLDATTRERYGVKGENTNEALLAAAYVAFKEKFCRFVVMNWGGGFDTHANHVSIHPPLVKSLSKGLNQFLTDLRNTPDPDSPGDSLMKNTLVILSTDFTRSAIADKSAGSSDFGTQHWIWSYYMLFGGENLVQDSTIVGGFDGDFNPLGWDGQKTVPFSEDTKLDPGHVTAALYRFMGLDITKIPSLPTFLRQRYQQGDKVGVFA